MVIGCLGAALPACADPPGDDVGPPAGDVGREDRPFSTTPSEPNHEQITAEGLPFLRPELLLALQAANVSTDVEFVFESANHFDDCNFSGGSEVIASNEAAAVGHLDPADLSPEGDARAVVAFGRALHAAQDFYAHSNWVEIGATGLVDTALTPWPLLSGYAVLQPDGIAVVEGAPPRRTVAYRRVDAPYPESAVVYVRTGRNVVYGLISGSVDHEPGDFCPQNVRMTHDELNKDHSDEPGREAQYVKARAFAIEQTRHEWCRLLSMTRTAWGEAGAARLLNWASDAGAAECAQPAHAASD